MSNIVCIIQARMGSTRLPGKVLTQICGKSVLEHTVNRIKKSKYINEVVVATTEEAGDNVIEEEAKRLGVKSFRGSKEDVLARYYNAAKENNADVIVRVTSDCPLIDYRITDNIIEFYINNKDKYDYVSNTIERTYPRGLDTEVFTFPSLDRAFKESTLLRDREHVTPYIWSNPHLFRLAQYKEGKDFSKYRWTLDTPEDLEVITAIYNNFNREDYFGMYDILEFLDKNPEISEINKDIEQKKVDESLFLIEANESHCDIVYKWANDPEVRKNSFNPNPIPYENHVRWFKDKINSENNKIYLLSTNNALMGIVRVESRDNENVINYSIDKNYRNKGFGKLMLTMLEEKLKKTPIKELTAYVKEDNEGSMKVFKNLNYTSESLGDGTIRFRKTLNN